MRNVSKKLDQYFIDIKCTAFNLAATILILFFFCNTYTFIGQLPNFSRIFPSLTKVLISSSVMPSYGTEPGNIYRE